MTKHQTPQHPILGSHCISAKCILTETFQNEGLKTEAILEGTGK